MVKTDSNIDCFGIRCGCACCIHLLSHFLLAAVGVDDDDVSIVASVVLSAGSLIFVRFSWRRYKRVDDNAKSPSIVELRFPKLVDFVCNST